MPHWLLPILAAPFIGSFLGLVIRRLPAGRNIVGGRSRCESCGATLAATELVPILSWAWSRGRCRSCGANLGWFYPGVEFAALAVAVVTVGFDADQPIRLWLDCALGWTLLTLAWIDIDHLLLPDILTLPLLAAGLAVTAWEISDLPIDHAIAAAFAYLLFRTVDLAYARWRGRDGLGQGDAKLVAAGGAWLGLYALSWLIFIAAIFALAAVGVAWLLGRHFNRASAIPFGAALALAIFILRICNLAQG